MNDKKCKTTKVYYQKKEYIEPSPLKSQYSTFNLNKFKRYTSLVKNGNSDITPKSRNISTNSIDTSLTRLCYLIQTQNSDESIRYLKTIFVNNELNISIISCFLYITSNQYNQFMLSLFSVLLKINKVSIIPNYNLLKNVLCNVFMKNIGCNNFIFLFDDATYKNKHKFLISFLVSLLLFSNNTSNYQEVLTEIIKNNICEESNKCDICDFFIFNILKKILIKYNPNSKDKTDTKNEKSNTFHSIYYNNKSSYLTYLSHINNKKPESKDQENCINNNNSNSHSSLAFLSTEKSLNKKLGSNSKHRKCSLIKRCSFNSLNKTKDTKIIPSRNSYNISLRKKTTSSKSQVCPSNLSHYNNISSSILQLDSLISQFKSETEMIKNQIHYN